MSSAPAVDEIWKDARWLVQALDPRAGMVRLVEMSAQSYREASFLDDRMFERKRTAHLVAWNEVVEAVPGGARRDARWIFHIGHVGSTLVSRLLGDLEGVLSIREPRFLRDLALAAPDVRADFLPFAPALFSRTFATAETAIVKATSFVSEIAGELVPPGERALFMYASPRAYIASILAGENSVKELAALEQFRRQRMAGRVPALAGASLAAKAAAAWACEMTALESAAERMADRKVAWADFDVMLGGMGAELRRTADFFGLAASPGRVEEIAAGPLMRRYSKALEFDYSPSLRRELLAEADSHYRGDIDSALAMLQSAAARSPLLERALERAKES